MSGRENLLQRLEDEEMHDADDEALEQDRTAAAQDEGMDSASSEEDAPADVQSIGFSDSASQAGVVTRRSMRLASRAAPLDSPRSTRGETPLREDEEEDEDEADEEEEEEGEDEEAAPKRSDPGVFSAMIGGIASVFRFAFDSVAYAVTLTLTGAWGIVMSLYALLLSLVFADLWLSTAAGSVLRRPVLGKEAASVTRIVEATSPHLTPSLLSPRSESGEVVRGNGATAAIVPPESASPLAERATVSSSSSSSSSASSAEEDEQQQQQQQQANDDSVSESHVMTEVPRPRPDDVPLQAAWRLAQETNEEDPALVVEEGVELTVDRTQRSLMLWSLAIAIALAAGIILAQEPSVRIALFDSGASALDAVYHAGDALVQRIASVLEPREDAVQPGVSYSSGASPGVSEAALRKALDAAVKPLAKSILVLESSVAQQADQLARATDAAKALDARIVQLNDAVSAAQRDAQAAQASADASSAAAQDAGKAAQAAQADAKAAGAKAHDVAQAVPRDTVDADVRNTVAQMEQVVLRNSNSLTSMQSEVREALEAARAASAAAADSGARASAGTGEVSLLEARLAEVEATLTGKLAELADVKAAVADAVARTQAAAATPAAAPTKLTPAQLETMAEQVLGRVKQISVLDDVQREINQALKVFAADRVNQIDYALGAAGGRVLSARTSPTYHRSRTTDLLGSLFGDSPSPASVVIDPDTTPGKCWAFYGSQGRLTVRLTQPVLVNAVTLEHIPAGIARNIGSAPREFSVTGYKNEVSREGFPLGAFEYSLAPEAGPVQTFAVTAGAHGNQEFGVVQFDFASNHGWSDYTCVYRVRVHGQPLGDAPSAAPVQ